MQTEQRRSFAQTQTNKAIYTGCLVTFFGPDGTGKSTTASLLEDRLHAMKIETVRCHWRPRLLPPRISPSEAAKMDTARPNEMVARNILVSAFLYIYTYVDFVFGYYFMLRPMMKEGKVIIYERYFHDILFHPRRYKLHPIQFLGTFLARLVPSPHVFVLLGGDPGMIRERKPELPLDVIRQQLEQMSRVLPEFGRLTSIDATANTPPVIVDKIMEFIRSIDY